VLYVTGNGGHYTKNLTLPWAVPSPGEADVFYHVTLDPDGVLRLYRHARVYRDLGHRRLRGSWF
jgi:hypothetical protein